MLGTAVLRVTFFFFLAVLGLCCGMRAFSGGRAFSSAPASLVLERGF